MFPATRRYAALLSTALLSTIAVPAMAEAVDDQASPAATIIVTARKDRDTLSDVSGTLIFAGKLGDVALLTDQPPVSGRNLRVALADIPGVLVSEVSNGARAALSYRGLGEPHESWNLLTLQDAIPAMPDMYSYPGGYFIPPLELVERVEFNRGASGLLFGPQPDGAINYVMQGPRREPGVEGQARVTIGSWKSRQGLGSVSYQLSLTFTHVPIGAFRWT